MTIHIRDIPGIDPTGTNVCTAAVQAFFLACRDQEGIVDKGTYLVDDTVYYGYNPLLEPAPGGLTGNRPLLAGVLRGEGIGASVLKWGGAANTGKPLLVVSAPRSEIRNLALFGNSKLGSRGVVFHHASGCDVRIEAHSFSGNGIEVNGLYYGTGADKYGYNEELRLMGRSYNNGGCGFYCAPASGADNNAMIIDGFVSEANASHGFFWSGQGNRFHYCRAEANGGYGFYGQGPGPNGYTSDGVVEHPWHEANTLGGIHLERATRNTVRTSDTFGTVTQDATSANLIVSATTSGVRLRGDQDLLLQSGIGVAPTISSVAPGSLTGQAITIPAIRLKSVNITHTTPNGTLTIDPSGAARFLVSLKANVGELVLAIPAGANIVNAEILIDFVQNKDSAGTLGWHVAKWSATKIGAQGTPVPLVMRWLNGQIPVIGAAGTATKPNTHDLVRLLFTGDWIEESRTLGVT